MTVRRHLSAWLSRLAIALFVCLAIAPAAAAQGGECPVLAVGCAGADRADGNWDLRGWILDWIKGPGCNSAPLASSGAESDLHGSGADSAWGWIEGTLEIPAEFLRSGDALPPSAELSPALWLLPEGSASPAEGRQLEAPVRTSSAGDALVRFELVPQPLTVGNYRLCLPDCGYVAQLRVDSESTLLVSSLYESAQFDSAPFVRAQSDRNGGMISAPHAVRVRVPEPVHVVAFVEQAAGLATELPLTLGFAVDSSERAAPVFRSRARRASADDPFEFVAPAGKLRVCFGGSGFVLDAEIPPLTRGVNVLRLPLIRMLPAALDARAIEALRCNELSAPLELRPAAAGPQPSHWRLDRRGPRPTLWVYPSGVYRFELLGANGDVTDSVVIEAVADVAGKRE